MNENIALTLLQDNDKTITQTIYLLLWPTHQQFHSNQNKL